MFRVTIFFTLFFPIFGFAPASLRASVLRSQPLAADIVDTAVGAGNFKTLVDALTTAGLVETLKSEGPYTVFAPTDEAFEKLPEGTVENILADKSKLKKILTYHVLSGSLESSEVSKLSTVETIEGEKGQVVQGNKGRADAYLKIDSAKVQVADINCDNGVIHSIDSVLMPPSLRPSVAEDSKEFDIMSFPGISAPFGFFDPLDLCPKVYYINFRTHSVQINLITIFATFLSLLYLNLPNTT